MQVFLIEDNSDDEMMVHRALRKRLPEAEVRIARDGSEAIAVLLTEELTADNAPDLIITCLKLPKLSGLEVIERLRKDERLKEVPIVILASSDEPRDIATGYALGANSYLHKPVDFDDFINLVAEAAHYWLVSNKVSRGVAAR